MKKLPELPSKDPMISECVSYITHAIISRSFHDQHFPVDGYEAIVVKPFEKFFKTQMDGAINEFKNLGWDCYHAEAYDARGPHHCFYFAKKEFE